MQLAAELLGPIRRERQRRIDENRLAHYRPYAKQREFHAAGATNRERLLLAANRFGKTMCGAAELAMHLTGRYPEWWEGKRFDKPIRAWAAGVTNESTRDVVQEKLIGPPDRQSEWGTGAIPKDALLGTSPARSIANLLDTVSVRHVSGGASSLQFKSYEKGREKWQGTALEVAWLDEEPPMDVYIEGLTRTNETGGIVFLTFTPLLGVSDVVHRFISEPHADRGVTTATIDDAEHFTPEQRAKIIASYPEHEREARTKGIPALGSGRVFPVSEEQILCDPIPIPAFWRQIVGIDFGWDHPFGAVHLAHDTEADIVYVTKTYRQREATPIIHAAAIKPWGEWLPVAWPHDGTQHDKGSGRPLAEQYRGQGLNMLAEHATHESGGFGLEAGIMEMLDRMQTGRWKVFRHLEDWLGEFRYYHRKNGQIVKERDDLLSASRVGLMMLRFADTAPKVRQRYEAQRRSSGRSAWGA